MKTIMVAGARGFVGSALVHQLNHLGYSVIPLHSKEIDLSHPDSVKQLLTHKADFIFHAAGKVGIASSWEDPASFYLANVNTTLHLLEYARHLQIPLHYVSAFVYGNQERQPISENEQPLPNNPYAHSKWMAEELCKFYHQAYSLPITISRPFNIYGNGQSQEFFIPGLIHQICHEEQITLQDSAPKRDYVYIDDVAEALISIMERGKSGSIYNIGTGVSHSCGELVAILQTIMKSCKKVHVKNIKRPNEIAEARADIAKICSETGWSPKYTLQQGIHQMNLTFSVL